MTNSESPNSLRVVARYIEDPQRFSASVTVEDLLTILNTQVLPVREVYVQVVDGDSVTLHRVGTLRVEFISNEAREAESTPLPADDPPAQDQAQESHESIEEEAPLEPEDSSSFMKRLLG